MVKYTCIYCKKESTQKTHFNAHVKCCEKKFNTTISKYREYNIRNMLSEYTDIIARKTSNYKCKICGKTYTSYNGLKNHIQKNKCDEIKLDVFDKLKQKYDVNNSNNLNNTINSNNTNNTNNTQNNIGTLNETNIGTQNNYNINNNIKLIPYDDIKYDYMSPDVLINAFEIPGEAFQSITADTFFHPKRKENHVIFCPNLKDGQIHVYNGNKFSKDGWDVVEKKDFFKQMLKKQMETLKRIYECNDRDDNPLELRNMTGFINLLKEFHANNEVIKEYTTKLNTLCYKNNDFVKQTKEETKEMRIKKMLKRAFEIKDNQI